jgi:hypothetical protein
VREEKTGRLSHSAQVLLPEIFKPQGHAPLIRLGRRNDGGYLVDARSVVEADFLLSFGINDDWTFERGFLRRKRVPVVAFDASVSRRWLAKRIFTKPDEFFPRIWRFLDYFPFFGRQAQHVRLYIGSEQSELHIPLSEAVRRHVPERLGNIFFKVDIEGSEYQVLEELIELAPRMTGLAIEFHDVDKHITDIEAFIRRFPLSLCHVHINNYCMPMTGKVPDVIELSFTKFQLDRSQLLTFPHPLDMPNGHHIPDVSVAFE